jgi:hypothetical protein
MSTAMRQKSRTGQVLICLEVAAAVHAADRQQTAGLTKQALDTIGSFLICAAQKVILLLSAGVALWDQDFCCILLILSESLQPLKLALPGSHLLGGKSTVKDLMGRNRRPVSSVSSDIFVVQTKKCMQTLRQLSCFGDEAKT